MCLLFVLVCIALFVLHARDESCIARSCARSRARSHTGKRMLKWSDEPEKTHVHVNVRLRYMRHHMAPRTRELDASHAAGLGAEMPLTLVTCVGASLGDLFAEFPER